MFDNLKNILGRLFSRNSNGINYSPFIEDPWNCLDYEGVETNQQIVDCKEHVGYVFDKRTFEKKPTNWAKFHFGPDGVHIIPTIPMHIEFLETEMLAMHELRKALLGEVTPSLRSVSLKLIKNPNLNGFFLHLLIWYEYDGRQSKQYVEDLRCVSSEASAGLGIFHQEYISRLDSPKKIPACGHSVYLRAGEDTSNVKMLKVECKEFSTWFASHVLGNALLAKVTSELLDVLVDISEDKKTLFIRFYHDLPISLETRNMWEDAMDQTSKAFAKFPHVLDGEIVQVETVPEEAFATEMQRFVYAKKVEEALSASNSL